MYNFSLDISSYKCAGHVTDMRRHASATHTREPVPHTYTRHTRTKQTSTLMWYDATFRVDDCTRFSAHKSFIRSNFCKDHRDKIEVPDPLVVEDLISDNLNNRRKQARLIKQYRDIFFPIFRKARPSFFRVLQRHPEEGRPCLPKYWKKYIPILFNQPCLFSSIKSFIEFSPQRDKIVKASGCVVTVLSREGGGAFYLLNLTPLPFLK